MKTEMSPRLMFLVILLLVFVLITVLYYIIARALVAKFAFGK